MYTTISTAGMSREDWLKLRKTGIGGSDAGAICGLNPYASPMSVYRDKTSEKIPDFDNEAMRQGRDLEDYVARRFMEATGLKVRRSNMMYRSEEHPCMIADVDRFIVGEDAGLECKTASAYNADKWKNGEVPMHYLIQCCHYMAVTGRSAWYIAVVILGQDFKYAKITRDDIMISNLIAIEEAFWNAHIIPYVMPSPDGSKACDKVLENYFHISQKESRIPLIGFDERLNRRSEVQKQIAELEREVKKIEQEVKLYLKENEFASSDRYRVTWANVDTSRLDTKRLKEEKPEIYRDFLKVSTSRRLSIKEID